ncbi:MAG TPA: PRD domain-containing protein [Eubacteriales bacterium]|nr:PRD domain-containing protein [Eubacteriales bacterium]
MLTTRQYEILEFVLQTDDFVTISGVAERFRLSARTVQRELDAIDGYLGGDNKLIEKKTGYGIRFCGAEADRRRVLGGMGSIPNLRPVYSQQERVAAILLALLMENEPRKIYTFTRCLGVSETTVGTDLNLCETWLAENGVALVRKPGVGVYVEADEIQRRQALVRLYYFHTGGGRKQKKRAHIQYEKLPNTTDVRKLFDSQKADQIDRMLDEIGSLKGLIQNDRNRRALVVHLYLILLRVSQGAGIAGETERLSQDDPTLPLAQALIDGLEREFEVDIPQGERLYLAMLLRTTKGLGGVSSEEADQQAKRIASRMIHMAEARTGVMIDPNGGFSEALKKHLVPTIMRLSMGMDIRNPILDDIKQHYATLYQLARECACVIEDELHVAVPDSELGYLAVHLGVALEDSRSYYSRRCRAIVCCPSGMVTAQLLALRVNREFPDIETADVVSTANLDYEQLLQNNVEMIISTVPLSDERIPSVQVSPFLTDTEKDAVWQLLKSCKNVPHVSAEHASIADLATALAKTRSVIDTILEILSNLFIDADDVSETVGDVIDRMAKRTAASAELAGTVRSDLYEREKYGSTITTDKKTMLLHCRTNGVNQVWFGVVRPQKLFYQYRNETIHLETVLVMFAPKSAARQTLGTLGAISRAVVENEAFMETLRTGGRKRCYAAVEKVLNTYYNEIIRQ